MSRIALLVLLIAPACGDKDKLERLRVVEMSCAGSCWVEEEALEWTVEQVTDTCYTTKPATDAGDPQILCGTPFREMRLARREGRNRWVLHGMGFEGWPRWLALTDPGELRALYVTREVSTAMTAIDTYHDGLRSSDGIWTTDLIEGPPSVIDMQFDTGTGAQPHATAITLGNEIYYGNSADDGWSFELVDNRDNLVSPRAVLDASDRVHFVTGACGRELLAYYAPKASGGWKREVVEWENIHEVWCSTPVAAVDAHGGVHVLFFESIDPTTWTSDLEYAYRTAEGEWQLYHLTRLATVNVAGLTLDDDGRLHVALYDDETQRLLYAHKEPGEPVWYASEVFAMENLESPNPPYSPVPPPVQPSQPVIDQHGRIQIAFLAEYENPEGTLIDDNNLVYWARSESPADGVMPHLPAP